MPFIFDSPISNDTVNHIVDYININKLKIDNIKIFVDLQNISIGKYYNNNIVDMYVSKDEKYVQQLFFKELLTFLNDKINKFRNVGYNNVYFFLYTDHGKNKLNEYFISTWKQNRRKSWMQTFEKDKQLSDANNWFMAIYTQSIFSIQKLLNTSPHVKLLSLKYVDSDFVPMIYILLDEKTNRLNNTLEVIVSNDHDYTHVLNYHDNILRYFFLNHSKTEKIQLDHRYNSYIRLVNKYKFKKIDSSGYKNFAKYYQIFHALNGDTGDGFGTIEKRKGLTYWISKIANILENKSMKEWREIIAADDFKYDILSDDEKRNIFRKRFFVVDFYFFSIMTIKYLNENLLDDYDKSILSKYSDLLDFNTRELFKLNADIIRDIVFNPKSINRNDAYTVLTHFIDNKNSKIFSESLWY